jgi:collagenase-like PrtC family protease
MMRLAVGYQLADRDERESFVDIVRDYREHIAEVYFPWPDIATGRSPLGTLHGCTDWTAQSRLESDLAALRDMGIQLDLLLNANCHGEHAVSRYLENRVGSLLDYLGERLGGVQTVTTASPFITHVIKTHFPQVRTRASVNMRIGTPNAMAHVADLFDSFCVQRDYNRDLEHLHRLHAWADTNGKSLVTLANSGCLHLCPSQTFHDNMVAHETAIAETDNVRDWNPMLCWRLYEDRAHWPALLQSTWIRPEDMHHYDALFDTVKLATRMHANPRMVIHAYAHRRHRGNLLDLFEPGFAARFAPHVIDNDRFSDDWFERTSRCRHRCESCDYCRRELDNVLVAAMT